MTDGPTEKQIAILKKNNREIPATKAEATAVIGVIFGNTETAAKPDDNANSPKSAGTLDDAIAACKAYTDFCMSQQIPKELWNTSTVWNTERMRRK